IKRILGTIVAALAHALPDRVPADSGGELLVLAFGGVRYDGTYYVTGELVAGGSGASAGKDGADVIETDATNCMNLPAEALELDAPIRVHRVALRRDSGGAGAQRGGLGALREYEILHGEVRFTHRAEGSRRRTRRRDGPHRHLSRRRRRGGRALQVGDDATCRRPGRVRDRGRRWLW